LLEAAGDLLRRSQRVKVESARIDAALKQVPGGRCSRGSIPTRPVT